MKQLSREHLHEIVFGQWVLAKTCKIVVKPETLRDMEARSEMEETFEAFSILRSSNQLPSDHTMASNQQENNSSPLVKQLRKLLFRRMLVGVNDGRFFMGAFHCIDKQGNIILQDAVEYRCTRRDCPSPMEQRCLGLILIPSSCRTSCHVDCSVEEQMSLLSLQN